MGSSGLEGATRFTRFALIAFLVSFALLNAQVTVTRLLAYRFFYHFVFFVISLSQLGLAAAGAWVYAARRRSWSAADLTRWLLILAAVPLLVLAWYAWLSPAPNLSFAKVDGAAAYPYLTGLALLLVALNFAGGMVLTLLFTSFKPRIGTLYASDLAGAALGCLASVMLMMAAGPVRAFLATGLAAALAVTLLPSRSGARGIAAVLTLLACAGLVYPGAFDPYVFQQEGEEKILRSEWNHMARTDAQLPGRYVIDGDASTDVRDGGPRPPSPEYELVPPRPEVAIIGVGAGPQLRAALQRGASHVLANDINGTILRWSANEDRGFNENLFHDPVVEVVAGEGRHTLRSSERRFDLVVMHAIDTWTASAQGAYSLTENFLYTREAMGDYLSRLKPGGVVSIRRWLFWPPRENLRLFSTVLAALDDAGCEDPTRQVVVVSPSSSFRDPRQRVWGFLLFSDRPLTEERLARLDRYVERNDYRYLYRPGASIDTPFTALATAEDPAEFHAGYPYIVTPAGDRNPFFFQFTLPWSRWLTRSAVSRAIYQQSSTLLFLCFGLALLLSLLLLALPLFRRRRDLRGDRQWRASLLYFACLGLGFMAFELPAIQVITLFLGHPTYALSVVLLGLLAAAGLGSKLMGRLPPRAGQIALILVALLALASASGLLRAVHGLIHLPDAGRLLVTALYLLLIGVPLGMPFVAGVRLLDAGRPHQVAWAWAANGAAAVIGSCALMILMVFTGSEVAFLVAAGSYALALLARRRLAALAPAGQR
jgi:predicted membrane-bound spermidine synthase